VLQKIKISSVAQFKRTTLLRQNGSNTLRFDECCLNHSDHLFDRKEGNSFSKGNLFFYANGLINAEDQTDLVMVHIYFQESART